MGGKWEEKWKKMQEKKDNEGNGGKMGGKWKKMKEKEYNEGK